MNHLKRAVTPVGHGRIRLLILCGMLVASPARARGFEPGRASFSITGQDIELSHRVVSLFVLPSELITLAQADESASLELTLRGSFGEVQPITPLRWQCTAPAEPGLYWIRVMSRDPVDSMHINIFVMVPYNLVKNGHLNGYRIGSYPKTLFKGLRQYRPPGGFVEVTPDLQDLYISPHFQLKQFLCKQEGAFPKYLVLRGLLLHKLEMILEKVNEAGYSCNTFAVLSGFRTPFYNKHIGNVKYSRHQWGGAADIFIDENPQDGMMDDLNHDGIINWKDAAVLYDIVDDLSGRSAFQRLIGGLARYRKTAAHGPFVHVDVRGFRARWGE